MGTRLALSVPILVYTSFVFKKSDIYVLLFLLGVNLTNAIVIGVIATYHFSDYFIARYPRNCSQLTFFIFIMIFLCILLLYCLQVVPPFL